MTQGVIIHLLGEEAPPEGLKTGTHYQGLSQFDEAMEVVVSQPGILELDDAWHFLLNLGCEPIHLLVALAENDRLRPLYPMVRLTGVARVTEDSFRTNIQGGALH